MPKLPRVAQKIFAGSAETNQTAVFGTMKTGSAEYTSDIKELMSSPAFLQGWKSAVENSFAPFMEETNGVQKVVTQQLAYVLENGIPEWDSETTYYRGSIAKSFSDGVLRIYISIIDDNIGNEVTDNLSWENIFDSSIGYAFRNLSNSTAITNCITEIPQDIKLELKDGVLTLKAGSKVYVPNGFESDGTTPKFDVKVIESDKAVSRTWIGSGGGIIWINPDNELAPILGERIFSGNTQPTLSGVTNIWYDTASNLIKATYDSGSKWTPGGSFPITLVSWTYTDSVFTITAIDQVFNGFGYIGSTVFALPGVKGLIPNGRNADGSLKNIEFTVGKVLTHTQSYTQDCYFYFKNNGNTIAQVEQSDYSYDEIRNIQKTANEIQGVCIFASAREDAGVISNFTPKKVFHALDYNDIIKGNDITTSNDYTVPSTSNVNSRIIDIMNNNYATKIKDSGAGGVQLTASNGLMFKLLSTRINSNNTWTFGKAFNRTVRVVGCRAAGGKYEHSAVLGTPTLTNVYVDCRGYDNGFMSTSIDVLAFGW